MKRLAWILLSLLILLSLALHAWTLWQLKMASEQLQAALQEGDRMLSGLAETSIEVPVVIQDTIPVAADVPFRETINVPIKATVPIRTTVNISQTVKVPLRTLAGTFNIDIPLNVDVPINTSVPLDLSIPVTIDKTVSISTSVPLDLEFPFVIDIADTPFRQTIEDLRAQLQETGGMGGQ